MGSCNSKKRVSFSNTRGTNDYSFIDIPFLVDDYLTITELYNIVVSSCVTKENIKTESLLMLKRVKSVYVVNNGKEYLLPWDKPLYKALQHFVMINRYPEILIFKGIYHGDLFEMPIRVMIRSYMLKARSAIYKITHRRIGNSVMMDYRSMSEDNILDRSGLRRKD